MLLPTPGRDGRLLSIAAEGADFGQADLAVANGVILADVLVSDLDRDAVVIDDVELESLVPHRVLSTICK